MPYHLAHYLPKPIYELIWTLRNQAQTLVYQGKTFTCPICHTGLRKYMAYRSKGEGNPTCPRCRTSRRHRHYWHYVNQFTDLFDGRRKQVLHLAPEHYLEPILRKRLGKDYVPAGYNDPRVKKTIDLNNVDEPAESYDVIICNHVLEHVPDDLKAMREIRRMLKPDGWALITVPQFAKGNTFEDPSLTSREERTRHYGQWDHLRAYGSDFADRLRSQGLAVEVIYPRDILNQQEIEAMRLKASEDPLFIARKIAA